MGKKDDLGSGFSVGGKGRDKGNDGEGFRDNETPKAKPLPKGVEGHKLGKGPGRTHK